MANEIIGQLETAVARNTEVVGSAIVLVNGIADRIQAGIDAAIANGATAEELQTLQDEVATLHSNADALAAAVQANT